MHYHKTGLEHNIEYKMYRMCHKTKQEAINVNYALHSKHFKKKYHECWVPTKIRFILTWINPINSIILELWKFIHFYFFFKWESQKIIWKSMRIFKSACQKENGSKFIKIKIFGNPKP